MATLPSLPTDVIFDILSRLPPKPLGRFKCVAKHWNTLINPTFHQTTPQTNPTLNPTPSNHIFCQDSLSVAQVSLANPKNLQFTSSKALSTIPVVLLGSCHGLLCVSGSRRDDAFIYNPETKKHRLVPKLPVVNPADIHPFTPRDDQYEDVEVTVFGFGYDSVSDDYKVLIVLENYNGNFLECRDTRLYSMSDDSWKSVKDELWFYHYLPYNAMHVDGVLYFIAVDSRMRLQRIKWFDFRTETFGILKLFRHEKPFVKKFTGRVLTLSELGGCLCAMPNYLTPLDDDDYDPVLWEGRAIGRADLWVLRENKNEDSWMLLFSILDTNKMFGSLTHIRPVVYSKDGGKVLLQLNGSKFCWYDWGRKKKKVEKVTIRGLPDDDKDSCRGSECGSDIIQPKIKRN